MAGQADDSSNRSTDLGRLGWRFELRALRYFVCIAEERSITSAADRLRIAQPALSRHIKRLETELGVAVFVRSAKGVELTAEGEILLDRAYAVLAQLEQAHHDVTAYAGEPRGVVVIGMPPTPGEFIAPPLLEHTRRHYPDIELRFVEGFSRDLEQRLTEGTISLAVMHDPPNLPNIVASRLLVERLYVVGAPGALDGDSYTLADAVQLPLIMPSRPNYLRILVDKHADLAGLGLNVIQRADGVWHLKALVRHGHGVSILTYGAVLSEVQQGTLVAVPICEPRINWALSIATKIDQRGKMATQIVERAVQTIVRDLVRQGLWK